MKTKNKLMLLAAMTLLATTAWAQGRIQENQLPPMSPKLTAPATLTAPTVTHDYDWYAAKTYTWTDANGASHSASLVDEVTNPYQMYDLLKWVYCNPEIPGNKTTAVTSSNVYYGHQFIKERYLLFWEREVEVGWDFTDNDVTAPYEDGHTLFLVKLKNYNDQPEEYTYSKSDIINYLSTYVESIELITDGMRAGTGNNQGTMVNIEGEFNRFFIIGKGKSYYWEPEPNSSTPPLAPFYNMFEEYSPTTTDEGATINDFYESMMDGDVYPVIHDCGSVIYFAHYFSMAGKTSTEEKALSGMILFIPDNRNAYRERDYDNDHQPTVGMYTILLDAHAAPSDPDVEMAYDVTLDWTSSLNTVVGSTIPQTYEVYIVATDENGNQHYVLLATTTETTFTYQVPQQEHSYTSEYIVHGVATQNDAFEAWSNIASVIIPGTNDFLYMELNHYESDYVASEELNYYRNFMQVENEDAINALTVERVQAGENSFTLYRFDFNTSDVLLPVAELNLTVNGNAVNYTIDYSNQQTLATYNYTAPTAGSLQLQSGGVINLSNIMLVDQFTASTALNDHPSRYGYVLMQNNIDNPKSTNTVEVPVLKTGSVINGFYTVDQVDDDTSADLTTGVKNAAIEMNLANNPAIYYYTIERGNNNFPTEAISRLQRRSDGTFMEMNNAMGLAGNIYEAGNFSLLDELVITGTMGDYMAYLPVIWTFGSNRVADSNDNSYGSPIWKTGVGAVSATVDGYRTTGENGFWFDEDGKVCRIYYPTINVMGFLPEDASVDYEPYMFRVWRICDKIRGYSWDGAKPVNDITAPRHGREIIIEQVGDEYGFEVGGDWSVNPIGFGAREDANIQFLVRFYYKKVDNNRDDKPLYYVVEQLLNWDEVPTGIQELNASSVISTTYVNAQGMKSDTPFSGINIVITRYSDGTTRTTKVVR